MLPRPAALGDRLKQQGKWVLRVQRTTCPFCHRSQPAWDRFVTSAGSRTLALDRDSVPPSVRSVPTVPRYLLVRSDGQILKAFGDSSTSATEMEDIVHRELAERP
jgi:hypothetical protein